MDVDDDFGFTQAFGQPFVLPAELKNLLDGRIDMRLGATGAGRETLLDASVSFLAPMGEDRRVKPFPAQQRADGSTARSRVGFGQDLELVGGWEAPPLCAWS